MIPAAKEKVQNRHWQEELDRRSLWLRLRNRLWIVPVAMAAGALVCLLIYTLVIVTVYGQRQYRETATYELNFAQNEETGKAYDYYNAATWQGLLFTHPDLSSVIRRELPEGMTLEMAQADTKADLISDIRYLSVEVTTPDESDTAQLSLAIRDALEQFGTSAKEFDSIVFLSATDPKLVVVSDRSRNAALLGMVLGLLFSASALWFHALMDDAVYTPEEAVQRYGIPVLGVLPAGGDAHHRNRSVLPQFLQRQLPLNLTAALRSRERVLLMSPDGLEDARRVLTCLGNALADTGARESGRQAQEAEGWSGASDAAGSAGQQESGSAEKNGEGLHCAFVPTGPADGASYNAANRSCRDVIAILHYGTGTGPRTENFLYEQQQLGYQIIGLLLADADGRFLQEYYADH